MDLTGAWTKLAQKCKGTAATLQCSLKGKFTVRNSGIAGAPSSVLRFYLSEDNKFSAGDTQLRSDFPIKAIKAGKTGKASLTATLPAGTSASGKFVIAVVDAANAISESDESNNVIVFGPLP